MRCCGSSSSRFGQLGSDRHTSGVKDIWRRAVPGPSRGGMRAALLLADPDPDRPGYLERNLSSDGFDVVEAGWSAQALDIAERSRPGHRARGRSRAVRPAAGGRARSALGPEHPGDRAHRGGRRSRRARPRVRARRRRRCRARAVPRARGTDPRGAATGRRGSGRCARGRRARGRPPRTSGSGAWRSGLARRA